MRYLPLIILTMLLFAVPAWSAPVPVELTVEVGYAPPLPEYEAVGWDLNMDGVEVCTTDVGDATFSCIFDAEPGTRSFTVGARYASGGNSPVSAAYEFLVPIPAGELPTPTIINLTIQ